MPVRSPTTGRFLSSSAGEKAAHAPKPKRRRASRRKRAAAPRAWLSAPVAVEAPKRKRRRRRKVRKAAPRREGWSLQTVLVPRYVGSAATAAGIARTKVRAKTPKVDVKGDHYRFQQWPASEIKKGQCRSKKIGKKSAGWEATLVYCERKKKKGM